MIIPEFSKAMARNSTDGATIFFRVGRTSKSIPTALKGQCFVPRSQADRVRIIRASLGMVACSTMNKALRSGRDVPQAVRGYLLQVQATRDLLSLRSGLVPSLVSLPERSCHRRSFVATDKLIDGGQYHDVIVVIDIVITFEVSDQVGCARVAFDEARTQKHFAILLNFFLAESAGNLKVEFQL